MTTVAIVKHAYVANFLLALMVNIFWVFNVKTATQGSKYEKWAYAIGASTGSVSGAILGTHLL